DDEVCNQPAQHPERLVWIPLERQVEHASTIAQPCQAAPRLESAPPVDKLAFVSSPLERLRALGFELPRPPEALASYVPTRSVPISTTHQLVWVAGQVPVRDGKPLYTGRVPDEVSIEAAQEAARECALN